LDLIVNDVLDVSLVLAEVVPDQFSLRGLVFFVLILSPDALVAHPSS